ncbi:MAG: rhomboid family intramembrane serine protease [Saprospiraceae bacterium]|nr:rhomboid family intramembrane serine protease [Saprospiraceae bacterium]
MFDSILKDIRYKLKTGGFWIQCIAICIVVFLLLNVLKAWFTFSNGGIAGVAYYDIIHSVSLSSEWMDNVWHIWVWLTHIFVHEGFFHLLWNMMWLYWFAGIVEDLIGHRHSKYIFFEAALFGALVFLISAQFIPWYKHIEVHAYGASAAVNGLLFAAATISPTYNIRLFIFGNVQLKYLAMIILVLDILFAGQNSNSGGHFAHLGGALWGYLYIVFLRKGIQMDFIQQFSIPKSTKKSRTVKFQKRESGHDSEKPGEDRLNKILDKIHKQGIQALSEEERSFLDRRSKE